MEGSPHAEWVRALLEEGLSLDALLLDLFAPAARRLGQLWEEDEADFLDVAAALGRLQSLTRSVCAHSEGADVPLNGRRVPSCCPVLARRTSSVWRSWQASSERRAGRWFCRPGWIRTRRH
ncbi:B12-binding domain-containing protein [Methylobacterium oryzae CBMB20]